MRASGPEGERKEDSAADDLQHDEEADHGGREAVRVCGEGEVPGCEDQPTAGAGEGAGGEDSGRMGSVHEDEGHPGGSESADADEEEDTGLHGHAGSSVWERV